MKEVPLERLCKRFGSEFHVTSHHTKHGMQIPLGSNQSSYSVTAAITDTVVTMGKYQSKKLKRKAKQFSITSTAKGLYMLLYYSFYASLRNTTMKLSCISDRAG